MRILAVGAGAIGGLVGWGVHDALVREPLKIPFCLKETFFPSPLA